MEVHIELSISIWKERQIHTTRTSLGICSRTHCKWKEGKVSLLSLCSGYGKNWHKEENTEFRLLSYDFSEVGGNGIGIDETPSSGFVVEDFSIRIRIDGERGTKSIRLFLSMEDPKI